jgi:hypothetical protein
VGKIESEREVEMGRGREGAGRPVSTHETGERERSERGRDGERKRSGSDGKCPPMMSWERKRAELNVPEVQFIECLRWMSNKWGEREGRAVHAPDN